MKEEYKPYKKTIDGVSMIMGVMINKRIDEINEYVQYCKALSKLENASEKEMKKKETSYNQYSQFYKKTDKIIRKFTEKTDMKSLNITNLLVHHRNELTEKVLSHIKNNGGFLAA